MVIYGPSAKDKPIRYARYWNIKNRGLNLRVIFCN